MDVSHLLGVLHLGDDLLQLALAGAVAQGPHDGSDLPHIHRLVVFMIKHLECLNNFGVNFGRKNLNGEWQIVTSILFAEKC